MWKRMMRRRTSAIQKAQTWRLGNRAMEDKECPSAVGLVGSDAESPAKMVQMHDAFGISFHTLRCTTVQYLGL